MHVTLVAPEGYTVPESFHDHSEYPIKVLHPTKTLGTAATPVLAVSEGLVLILTEPGLVNEHEFSAIVERGIRAVEINQALAFVPPAVDAQVLATAAACYAFSAHAIRLAGGLDSSLPIHELGLDTQLRLAGRAVESLTVGISAVTGVPALEFAQYLSVMTKNLTSRVQNAYLAPLLTGVIDHSFRTSHMDTSAIDLQRSPGGDDVPDLTYPKGAFGGSQIVREWGESLSYLDTSKFITSEARRIPDRRLPNFHAFINEVWDSTGIPLAQRRVLEDAFSDITASSVPEIVFVARSNDPQALDRLQEISARVDEPLFWWLPDTHTVMERTTPGSDWYPSPHDLKSLSENTCICYLIGTPIREAPWVSSTPTIVIADFSLTDIESGLKEEWIGHVSAHQFKGSATTLLMETLTSADHVVAGSLKQRDFLLGALSSVMRLNQYTYDEDHSLKSLISIESGIDASLSAIERPVHPFERVQTTPEYDEAPYEKLAKISESFVQTLRAAPERVIEKLKGVRS